MPKHLQQPHGKNKKGGKAKSTKVSSLLLEHFSLCMNYDRRNVRLPSFETTVELTRGEW